MVEDAISGIKSGRAAGSRTLAVCTSTSRQILLESDARPDYLVEDLARCAGCSSSGDFRDLICKRYSVSVKSVDGKLEVTMDKADRV